MKHGWTAGQPGRDHSRQQAPRTVDVHKSDPIFTNSSCEPYSTEHTSDGKACHFQKRFPARSVISNGNGKRIHTSFLQHRTEGSLVWKSHEGIEFRSKRSEDGVEYTLGAPQPALLIEKQNCCFLHSDFPEASARSARFSVHAIRAAKMTMLRQYVYASVASNCTSSPHHIENSTVAQKARVSFAE